MLTYMGHLFLQWWISRESQKWVKVLFSFFLWYFTLLQQCLIIIKLPLCLLGGKNCPIIDRLNNILLVINWLTSYHCLHCNAWYCKRVLAMVGCAAPSHLSGCSISHHFYYFNPKANSAQKFCLLSQYSVLWSYSSSPFRE